MDHSSREEFLLSKETFLGPYGIRRFCSDKLQSFMILEVIQSQISGFVYSTVKTGPLTGFCIIKSSYLNGTPVEDFEVAIPTGSNASSHVISCAGTVYDEASDTFFEIYHDTPYKLVHMRDYLRSYDLTADAELHTSIVKSALHNSLVMLKNLHKKGTVLGNLTPENLVYDHAKRMIRYAGFMKCTPGYPSYRSPELLLRPYDDPTTAADIWSLGCIFAELAGRVPIFCAEEELLSIYRVLARGNKCLWVKDPVLLPHSEQLQPLDNLVAMVPSLQGDGLDLLMKMLCLNPNDRISVDDALRHVYFDISAEHQHLEEVLF